MGLVIMCNIINLNPYLSEKGGVTMCTPINRIYGKSPLEVLQRFGNPDCIPVDLEGLLSNIGISALPMDFSFLEEKLNKGHILGLVLKDDKNAVIYYSEKDSPNRQRFTIAHELGHICKNLVPDSTDYPYIDWRIEEESENEREKTANIFAGELLIPLHKLKEVYLSMAIPFSFDLAKLFGTSLNVMEERLNYLKINYYNREGQAVIHEPSR